MSDLVYKDTFEDLRYWSGIGALNFSEFYSSPSSVDPDTILSRRTFFDVQEVTIRFYDKDAATLGDFYMAFNLSGREIFRVTSSSNQYAVTDSLGTYTGDGVARSAIWHEIRVVIGSNYQVYVDDVHIGTTSVPARLAFDVTLSAGRWDDFTLTRAYLDDFQGGTGTINDLMVTDAERADETVTYTLHPGYFLIDDIEYYHFANMGHHDITPTPSGAWICPSGLPYVIGQPYFVCDQDDIHSGSGYIRTPLDRNYIVTWDSVGSGLYIPTCSGTYASHLVYEHGDTLSVTMNEPIAGTKLVLTDEGGTPTQIKTSATYIESVKIGNRFGAFATVSDMYGGPVIGATVTWYRIDQDDTVTTIGSSTTNENGIAEITFTVTEAESFHIYASTNPVSSPTWVYVPQAVSSITGTIFQLDISMLDSMEARSALGHNIWAEEWGSNPGEPTGLSSPYPTTHGQWEADSPEQRRPPMDEDLALDEANGYFNARDLYNSASGLFDTTIDLWMNDMYVARRGYWGTHLISGSGIRSESVIAQAQVINPDQVFEVTRDYAATSGTYSDIMSGTGDDGDYYVFYQMASGWTGAANPSFSWGGINTPDTTGTGWCFRGVGLYDEDAAQGWQVEDLLSNAEIQ